MKKKTLSKTAFDFLCVMAILAAVCACAYVVIRTVLFSLSEGGLLEKGFGALLLLAECFVVIHGIGYAMNVFKVFRNPSVDLEEHGIQQQRRYAGDAGPTVAILVPARNEPSEVLESTFITINNIDYQNKKVYFLDDSTQDNFRNEAKALADAYGLTLFRRTKPWHGAKAGIVNDCLETLSEDYVAIFDADQNPMPKFLNALIPLLEKDPRLAFVQTPQYYSNTGDNDVAMASTLQQAVFYEYICEGKGIKDSMVCCGTNVIFRAKALKEIGGFDETTVTEDFATSLHLHSRGWKSLYYGHVCAFGSGPESLGAYFQQQFRWACGTLSVFKKILKQFIMQPFSLKPRQWLEYFFSSTYYLIGIFFLVLMLCPIVYLLFNVPTFFAKPEVYFLSFAPYIFLSTGVFYMALKKRRYSIKHLFIGQLIGILAFSVYIRAAFSSLFGIKISFGVTPKTKGQAISYWRLWPQIGMLAVNYVASVWGFHRYYFEREPAIIVNSFWAFYHFLLLSSLIYFNRK